MYCCRPSLLPASARSATPDSGSSREEQKQQQQQQQQLQQEASNDIFNRPVSMMNAKPESRGSTLTRDSKSPKMPRKLESTVQTPLSPTHVRFVRFGFYFQWSGYTSLLISHWLLCSQDSFDDQCSSMLVS